MSLQQNEDTSGFQVDEDGLSTITKSFIVCFVSQFKIAQGYTYLRATT